MPAALFQQLSSTVVLAAVASLGLLHLQASVSLGDLLGLGAAASLTTLIACSFLRSPAQFCLAAYERLRYIVLVPVCSCLMLAVLVFRIAFLLFKLAFKAALAFALWLLYLVSPIDLIPDLIPVLGLIDDIVLFLSVSIWVAGSALTSGLRTQISVSRPTTSFP